jgi:1-acyl-sn-glycerol-3-phosphate acyltransferase
LSVTWAHSPPSQPATGPFSVLRASTRFFSTSFQLASALGRARVDCFGADRVTRVSLQAQGLARAFADILATHGLKVQREGQLPSSPCVIVANHISWLDPLALCALIPCLPIAKREVEHWPVIGNAGRSLGVIFVRRGDAHSGACALLTARRALQAGVSVLNFPEGTTTNGDGTLPFRRGVFGLARLTGVPVVPVAIEYDHPDLSWTGDARFLPHYLKTASRAAGAVKVKFGWPLAPRRRASAQGLADEARARILKLLGRPQ